MSHWAPSNWQLLLDPQASRQSRRSPTAIDHPGGIIIAFFTVVPIYSAGEGRRDDSAWRQACDDNDVEALAMLGLS